MKRLLPCFILALAFHAIILSTDFSWLRLASSWTPAAKPLSITLSTDMSQKRKAKTATPVKQPEKLPKPRFNQETMKNLAAMQTVAPVEQSDQFQKPLPATPPEPIVKKIRPKKSLKALTFKKQQIKTIEAIQTESPPKPHVALKTETQIITAASSEPEPVRQPYPADEAFIKKKPSTCRTAHQNR